MSKPTVSFPAASVPASALVGNIDPTAKELILSERVFSVPILNWRVHDALGTFIGTAGNDDLGITPGTFGTGTPVITAGDLKNAGATTRYARQMIRLPWNYADGQTVKIRCHAGMLTTVASSTATLDVEAYLCDEGGGITDSELVNASPQDINNTTFADYDYSLTVTNLVRGSLLDVRLVVAVNDSATGTAVDATIGAVKLLCDTQG